MKNKIYFFFKDLLYLILPKRLSHLIAYLGKFRHFKISYSQFGEDLILSKYLDYKKIVKGKYLDIGACHPRWISNTHLLHKKGFTGYCIDLDEQKLKWFRFARGNSVKTICGVVSNSDKEFEYIYTVKTNTPFSQIDTTSKEQALFQEQNKNIQFEKKKLRIIILMNFLKKLERLMF